MIASKTFFKIIGLLCLILNIYIVAISYNGRLEAAKKKQAEKHRKKLELLHACCNIADILEIEAKKLIKNINEKKINELDKVFNKWYTEFEMPASAFKLVVFNTILNNNGEPLKHTPLNVPESESQEWEYLIDNIDVMHRSDYNQVNLKKIKDLNIILPDKLIRKPYKIKQVNITELNTYAIWFNATKNVDKNRINSGILLCHDLYIKSRMTSIIKTFFKQKTVNPDCYGYFNSNEPATQYLPQGLSAYLINEELSNSDLKSGYINIDKNKLLAYSKPNGNVFVAINSKPFTPIPLWALSIFFLWFPIWVKQYINSKSEFRFSLNFIFILVFLLVLIQPITLIADYWNKMIESKRSSIKQEKISQMHNNLMQIDAKEAEILRANKHLYQKTINIVQNSETNPLGVDNHKLLQKFIDETIKLELQTIVDITYILDINGKYLRFPSTAGATRRIMPAYPQYYIDEVLEHSFNDDWEPKEGEFEHIKKHKSDFTIEDFMKISPKELETAYMPLVEALSKEILDFYNLKHNKIAQRNAKNAIASGIISSSMGGNGEEYIKSLCNNICDFYFLGYEYDTAITYVDILRDKNNMAKYAIFLSSGKQAIIKQSLEQVFFNPDKWPKNTEYLAATTVRWTFNYPYIDLWKRFKTLLNIVKPPIIQYSTDVKINGEPYILCGNKGRRTLFHTLFAIMPLKVVDQEIKEFELKVTLVALIIAILIVYVIVKIYNSIFIPTNSLVAGINAMSSHNTEYKVVVETNDEWEKLADAFNTSIKAMKDFEVATFIQNTLLPAEKIKSDNIEFIGQTVSADGIGGDYFDAFVPGNKQMMFLFGDVSGHSVGATLVVSMAHAGFASLFDSNVREPAEILKSFSNLMLNSLKRVKMMTCFAGFIDEDGNMKCSNAGQTFPLIVDEKGNITKVSVIGYPLGSAKRAKFKQETIKLPEKCRIILYSDGIIEAMNEKDEPFGYERFELLVKQMACKNTMEEFKKNIYKYLKDFCGSVPWNDDCSIAIIDYCKA